MLERLEQVKVINREAFYERNPDQRPPSGKISINKEIDYLGMADSTDNNSSATLKKLKLKFETISSPMKLFFAIVKGESVTAPKINSALEALYQKSSSLTAFVSQFRKALEVYTKQHSKERDYLNRSVDMSHL